METVTFRCSDSTYLRLVRLGMLQPDISEGEIISAAINREWMHREYKERERRANEAMATKERERKANEAMATKAGGSSDDKAPVGGTNTTQKRDDKATDTGQPVDPSRPHTDR